MLDRKVGVPLCHVGRAPAPQLLQHVHRRPVLSMPARARVPQIVPPQVLDACPLECRPPHLRAHLAHRLAFVREHVLTMPPELPAKDIHRRLVQWHANRLPRLGFRRRHEQKPPTQIDVSPTQALHVSLPQSCRQREHHHCAQMVRKLDAQPLQPRFTEIPFSPRRLLQHSDRRTTLDPPPLVSSLPQDRSHDR